MTLHRRCCFVLSCIALLTVPTSVFAQPERVIGFEARDFALTNATVVTEPGKQIEAATVLIQDGMITAVGEAKNVTVPPGVQTIDVKGHFVYAGFIDAANSSLLDDKKKPDPSVGRKVDFTRHVLAGTRPDNRKYLSPEFIALDGLKTEANIMEPWRKAGFATVHVLPTGRIISGQGTLLTTSNQSHQEALLNRNTWNAMRLYAPGGELYPATLMGATAHMKQLFLDTHRYALHWGLYNHKDAQVSRPSLDPVLAAVLDVINKKQPAIFEVETFDDIHRALNFAELQKINLKLWGGRDVHRALDRIKKHNVDVVFDLNFGNEPKIEATKKSDKLITEVKDPQRVQLDKREQWRKRVGSLQAMQQSNLRWAAGSHKLKNANEILPNIRKAITQGLSSDDALAGLTTHPAAMLDQETKLGKIQPGFLGHLVVMTGPFDHKDAKVRYLFVDRQKFEYNESAKPLEIKDEKKPEVADKPVAAPKADTPGEYPTELRSDRLRRPFQTNGNVLIKNATVLTGTGKTLKQTSILTRNGKIVAIGSDLKLDDKTKVIDATGMYVMPGIIDTHSHIMVTGGLNDYTQSIVCEIGIKDAVNTADDTEFRALAGGVTTARLLHGSANVIGGQDAVVKLKIGKTAHEHILHDAPQGVKFALGENVKYRETRFPNTRLGVEATLNRGFMEALDYRRRWMEHDSLLKRGEVNPDLVLPPRRDLRLESLADIINHKKFIHSHCYRADEILMLLRVAEGLGIRVWSLQHVLEGYKVAPEIVKHGASCSTFADWWAYKVEAYDATPFNAALIHEAGGNVVIKSDDWELIRHLYYEAAKTIRYGNMPPEVALRTITLNAARELGLQDRIGSIEVGKDADFGIYNGHPFHTFTRCEWTLIEGEVYYCRQESPTAMSKTMQDRSRNSSDWSLPPKDVRNKTVDHTKSKNGRYAYVGATLHPIDQPPIVNGTLVVENGKIIAIGTEMDVLGDIHTVDVSGLHIYPGLIDAGTTLGIAEIRKVKETNDNSESGGLQPDLRAGVAINPDSELIPVARAGGITTVMIRPTGGIISGQTSTAKLGGWTAPEMIYELEAGLQINWSGDGKKIAKQLKEMFDQARLYHKLRDEADADNVAGPIVDPRLAALRPYLEGKKTTFIEANSRQAIAEAMQFAEEQNLKLVITGGTNAWKLAKELKERDIPVIIGPVMTRPVKDYDPQDAPYANAGLLAEAGVKFCIRSNNASNSRNAPLEAAMAVAHGLKEEDALRSVTLSAAEILGLYDQVGSLTVGKNATFIITDGSPLQITTQIKGVTINGEPHKPESRQTRFYERYRERLKEVKE